MESVLRHEVNFLVLDNLQGEPCPNPHLPVPQDSEPQTYNVKAPGKMRWVWKELACDTEQGPVSISPYLPGSLLCPTVTGQEVHYYFRSPPLFWECDLWAFLASMTGSTNLTPAHTPLWFLISSPPSWALATGWSDPPSAHTSHRQNLCHPPLVATGSGTPWIWRSEQLHLWAVSQSRLPQDFWQKISA